MDLFNKVKNIIKSNINFEKEDEIDLNSYEEFYFDDAKEIKQENKLEEKYYAILELDYGASFAQIKSAYKKLLKKYHPDLFQNKPEKQKIAKKITTQINEAYTYFERKYL